MNSGKDVLKYLRDEGKNLEVPKSLEPEQMEKMLKQKTAQNTANKYKVRKIYHNFAAVAACLCVILLGVGAFSIWKGSNTEIEQNDKSVQYEVLEENVIEEVAATGISYPKINYEDIYAAMSATWENNNYVYRGEMPDGASVEQAIPEAPAADMEQEKQMAANAVKDEFGKTNVQTIGVDEGDIVKNDG